MLDIPGASIVGTRCVVSPVCCIEDVTGDMCGVSVTMPRTIFLTPTGIPPGCQFGSFPNYFNVLGADVLSGSALISGQSYEMNLGPNGLGVNGTYYYAQPILANLVPGGDLLQNDYGLFVDNTTTIYSGTTFELDIYLQIVLNLACPFGPTVCDPPLPGVTGPTWPFNIQITSYCVPTAPIGTPFPFFKTLFSGESAPCPVIGCFNPNNPLPAIAKAETCCIGSEFEITP